MKNIGFYCLLVLFSVQSAYAQSIVEDGNRWIVGWFAANQGMPGATLSSETLYEIPTLNADTSVSNLNYKKLYQEETLIGCLREDIDSVIYFLPKDSLSEHVFYDFGVQSGDTIYVYYGPQEGLIVDYVNSGVVAVSNTNDNATCEWHYSFGAEGGLFETCILVVATGYTQTTCMSDTNGIRWGGTVNGTRCEKTLVGVSGLPEQTPVISLYPNPARNMISVSFERIKKSTFSITNVLGQIILQEDVKDVITLDLASWERGIYFLQCHGLVKKFQLN